MKCSAVAFLVLYTLTRHAVSAQTSFIEKCDAGYGSSYVQNTAKNLTAVLYTIKDVRSQLDCSIRCLNEDLCANSHYAEDGLCVLSGYGSAGSVVPDFVGVSSEAPNPRTGSRTCEDLNCPDNSICLYSCVDGGDPVAYCLVDTQSCATSPQMHNLAHYYMGIYSDGTNTGYVQRMPYTKTLSYTSIRVQWYGTIRAHYHTTGCGRWRFFFNGNDCSDPGRIEFVDYGESAIDDHRAGEIEGICHGLAAGTYEIGLYVDACTHYGTSDSYTGWNNPRHIMVHEIDMRSNVDKTCPGLSVFNTQTHVESRNDGTDTIGHSVFSFTFTKTDSSTGIYVRYLASTRIHFANSELDYCSSWYATFNGHACSDPREIRFNLAPLGSYTHSRFLNPHRMNSFHGVCYGIGAGQVTIDVRIGHCYITRTGDPGDVSSGWNSMSRLTAEEVREGQLHSAVINSEGLLEELPFFNVKHHAWYNLDSRDSGVIQTLSYVKDRADTELQLTWEGDARSHHGSHYSCCRWWFSIDNTECASPGKITQVTYVDQVTNYHRPMVVSGICYGISAGSHDIRLNVGTCPGYPSCDCYTGWYAENSMVMMEVRVKTRYVCTNRDTCNVA